MAVSEVKNKKSITDCPKMFSDELRNHIGEKYAFLCVRYTYRGIISGVGDDYVILANSVAVEDTGAAQSERARTEDPIGSSIRIRLDAVELAFQPTWVHAPLPGED